MLEGSSITAISVLVDNDAARQNVCRFLEHKHYQVSSQLHGSDYLVTGICGDAGAIGEPVQYSGELLTAIKKVMVLVSSVNMGHGDDGLGDMLMFNFLKTLKEMGPELWRVIFVNGGVKFVADDSEAVPVLQELVSVGVSITACGACLAYYHLLDKLQVGQVTNMLEIVTAMKEADSVITV
jgi:selenium metabolism protein YedF